MSGPVRVLVVDDQALVREGLMTLLDAVPDITPVAAAADGEEAVALSARHRPDVVLMDLRMPRLDGVEATRRIREAQPDTEIVVLTTHADEDSILDALRAGARGYLTKDAGIAEISRAVHAAADHQALLDPVVQSRLIAAAGRRRPASRAPPAEPARRPDPARGRGPVADRARAVQRRDRRRRSWSAKRRSRPTSTTCSRRSARATAPRPSTTPTRTGSPTDTGSLAPG